MRPFWIDYEAIPIPETACGPLHLLLEFAAPVTGAMLDTEQANMYLKHVPTYLHCYICRVPGALVVPYGMQPTLALAHHRNERGPLSSPVFVCWRHHLDRSKRKLRYRMTDAPRMALTMAEIIELNWMLHPERRLER